MAVIIPNSTDTTSGNKYEALDQAEPDSLDFEMLGLGGYGVLTGCGVTSNSSASNVAVAAGVVVLRGIPYTVTASPTLAVPSAPADNRFDVVVARITAGSAVLTVVSGANDSTNPSFPKSASVLTSAGGASTTIDFSTDVVLAALYRSAAATITESRIVDKRRMVTVSIFDQGASAPLSGYGEGKGSLFYKTGTPSGTSSGVYVKTDTGPWIELAQNIEGPYLPIGAGCIWPTDAAVPTNCVEANGQLLSTSTYATLFGLYGYLHGGSGGLFAVPNYNDLFVRGTTNTSLVGTAVGSSTVAITEANLPVHSHTYAHTHTYTHTHGVSHGHTGSSGTTGSHEHSVTGSTDSQGSHSHSTSGSTNTTGNHTHVPDTGGLHNNYYVPGTIGTSGALLYKAGDDAAIYHVGMYPNSGNHSHTTTGTAATGGSHAHNVTGTAASTGSHAHTVSISTENPSTSSQSASTTAGQSSTTTGTTGSGTALSIVPSSSYVRWIIRAV